MILRTVLFGCVLVLGACQPSPSGAGDNTAANALSANSINGQATYLERIAPPPGATLSVQLLDTLLADTPMAVIASAEFKEPKGPPFAFSLPFDRARLRQNGVYGLHASLRDAEGRILFVTDTRVPVTPGSAAEVQFRMIQVANGNADGAKAPPASQWLCGEQRIDARFDQAADNVALEFDGSTLSLPHVPAGSGARYADELGNEFWTQGNEGTLTLAGKPRLDCSLGNPPSPWDQAKAQGVAFRGVGNEPGWLVEVGTGTMPALHADLDYGQRRIEVDQVHPVAHGFSGTTRDGLVVELDIRNEACSDGMSDETFPAHAVLAVAGKKYQGCGRFLQD